MTFASFELDRGRCSRGKQTPRPGDCAAHAAARVPRVRMSRKTLKRIATNTVPSKKYVLGDVLGEGLLPRLPRRRASCLRRRGMTQEPTRTQRSPLPARLLCQLRAAAAGSPFGALTALIPVLCRGFWAGAGGHAGGRRRQVWAAGCCEDH